MGTFETPVTMQAGTGHKYFSSPANAHSESDKSNRLVPRVGKQTAAIGAKIKLVPRNGK